MKRKRVERLSTTKKSRTRAETEQIVTLLLQLLEHNIRKLLRARR